MSARPEILTSLCVILCFAVWLSWLAAGTPRSTKFITGQNLAQLQSQLLIKTWASQKVDACSLLTGKEISAVLGEPLKELKPSTQATGNMNMSHCLFITRDFAKSASLAVATPGAGDSGAHNLRAFWRNQFHSRGPQEEDKRPASIKTPANSALLPFNETKEISAGPSDQSESESEEDARKPRAISGLGEEAYWVGSPLAGALYVLQGDLFLRISVGGVPKESMRIAKSKSLANAVLPRLHHHPA
jgi:hypothetical protein